MKMVVTSAPRHRLTMPLKRPAGFAGRPLIAAGLDIYFAMSLKLKGRTLQFGGCDELMTSSRV